MNNEKEKLISDIQLNFKALEEIFKTKKAQEIFNSIGLFSFEEYSKFFQNLSNKEYTSMSENPKKNREPISIDKSKLKLDYSIMQKFDKILPAEILKANLEVKGIPKKIKENLNKVVPKENIDMKIYMNLYLEGVSENIDNLLNSRSELNPNDFKLLIKTFSNLIRINDNIYVEQDKKFLELLEKYLDKSISNFYDLSSYWLYTEFLLCPQIDNNENNLIYKRYDKILENIVQILIKNLNNNLIYYKNEFSNFISNVPIYNKIFIDFVIKFHRLSLDMINDELFKNTEKSISDILPYLENMKFLYINIINNRNLFELKEKDEMKKNLLENFLIMARYKKYLSAKAIIFIFKDIYEISEFEEGAIKQFAFDGLKEIKKLTEIDKNIIEQRFFFYLCLCVKNKDTIDKLPSLYQEVNEPIRDFINNYNTEIEKLLKGIDQFLANKLIENEKCKEKSENLVIIIIKNIYGDPNYKWENSIENEKLYRSIKAYYIKHCPSLIKGAVELANKIPIGDFFSNTNFILNKIKQNENNPEILNDIFEQLNSTEANKNINGNNLREVYNYYDYINDKIIFYILYFFQNIKKDEYKFYKDLMVKYHIRKLYQLKNEGEEKMKNELNNISTQLKKDSKINLLEIFNIYDDYKENIKNISEIQGEEIDKINNEFDCNLINIINEKLLVGENNKYLEEYYKKLSQENKDIFKEKILKNISSQAKGNLDLIEFGDI